MVRRKQSKTNIQVDALRHNDTRVNIPTSELRDFAGDDEINPIKIRYPRDTSRDPQLVWNGKDEQDENDLEVPAVPIYIQEKIQPQAIIEEVRRQSATTTPVSELPHQIGMFSDFNGIEFEDLIEFYQHKQHWSNRMILGDSLLVMTSLAMKEGMKGKVQMIYLDPPYGIKFGSNWQISTRKRDVKDGSEEDLVRQPEQVRAFRDTWEKGIHSYLSYLRDRLYVSQALLTDSGSIFVQIGDENVHLVRSLLDEVFGRENFVSLITFKKTGGQSSNELANVSDYILWYAKNKTILKYHSLQFDKRPGDEGATQYNWFEMPNGIRRAMSTGETFENLPSEAKVFQLYPLVSMGPSQSDEPVYWQGKKFIPSPNQHWKTTATGLSRLAKANRLIASGNTLRYVNYLADYPVTPYTNLWTDTQTSGFASERVYVVQTLSTVIERCVLMTTDPGDLVIDPTMGSGTTAFVAEQWGRRWITIDTSRVALALARTRLMSARYPFYLLSDSTEGVQKEIEVSGKHQEARVYTQDVKQGFVYQRVPHIMMSDVSGNPEIDLIYDRWQPILEEKRAWLNQKIGKSWEEWEIPRDILNEPKEVQSALKEYWELWREYQRQIEASIQRNSSNHEFLYDRPYEDRRKIRVTGPFTVESLSPHRILDPGYAESARQNIKVVGSYEQMVIDNLKTAGVQNTRREERLKFDTLDSFAGVWLHAVGTYTDANDEERRVAVSIGSEHGTVGSRQIKEAAKEAVKGLGYDLLLVCGFAFDAVASEETKRYGKLDVQIVRMNSDLMMGNALKRTDRANLFTIFGEPDIKLEKQSDGNYVVDILGLDIYDPTTGQIRNSSTKDIACWFIDTAYNDESFFVRHAYFLGNDSAYDNLKRALRVEIDERAWQMLYSTRSVPFERPESGRIAIKVINHYGDEVLKVYTL